jgi:hypothetical protein
VALVLIAGQEPDYGVAAGPGHLTVKLTPAGQRAARAVALARLDLPTAGWTGGFQKSSVTTLSCAGFRPKQSDLVVNGHAETAFTNKIVSFGSEVTVYALPAMVQLDWKRSMRPGLSACVRSTVEKNLPGNARVVSVGRLGFPKAASLTRAYRVVVEVRQASGPIRINVDVIFVARGRTEVAFTTTALPSAFMARVELGLARAMVSRIAD